MTREARRGPRHPDEDRCAADRRDGGYPQGTPWLAGCPLRTRAFAIVAGATLVAASAFAAETPTAPAPAPYVLVLGTAQDGGIPQIGGNSAPDEAARRDPARRRLVASILICDPVTGGRWLVDATPDVVEQMERARAEPASRATGAPRQILDGIFLSHAHIGHYLGLAEFGREGYGAHDLPLHVSPKMASFLSANGPWDLMVRLDYVRLVPFAPGEPIRLTPRLSVTPIEVPHRAEYTDTYAFLVRGPRRALLYLPDIDKWERWETPVEDWIAKVDVALLDGTFWGEGELPGRSMAEVPHPLISDSLARFGRLPAAERAKIRFTHLNHTNPAALPDSPQRRAVEAAGMRVAEDGDRIDL